jgi:hypothetical protein
MKNFTTLTALLFSFFALLCYSSDSLAQQSETKHHEAFYSEFYVMEVKSMQFKMTYNTPVFDRVTVRIFDAARNILFVEKSLVYKKYQKYFDLTGFNDGQYTFELTDGNDKFVQSFDVVTTTIRTAIAQNNSSVTVKGF